MPRKAERQPARVTVVDKEVVQDGPDGVALSMTPEAAEVTGERLVAAARVAREDKPARGRASARSGDPS